MTDDLAARFAGIDGPRPLPEEARDRLQARLAQPSMADALGGLDQPRLLPDALRERLEGALLAGDAPRVLPVPFRRRLELSLRNPTRLRSAGIIAAALLVVAASVALLRVDSPRAGTALRGSSATTVQRDGNDLTAGGTSAGSASGEAPPVASGTGAAGGSSAGGAAASRGRAAFPPPYAFGSTVPARATTGTPLAVALVGGDAASEAGFGAYVSALNESGGAGGHRIDIVDDPDSAVATVNLSPRNVETPKAGALLEGLAAGEASLRGRVFAVASVVERQAHIAASAAFPQPARGSRAVIFTGGDEPFATRVPAAIEEVLRARGVTAVRVPYAGGLMPGGDAAFLSLPTDTAESWLQRARASDYAPDRGIWGVYSLADESLVDDMPASVRVVSPFMLGSSSEASAVRAASPGKALSVRSIHGWLTAKYLAVAIWRAGATSAPGVVAALENMDGFDDGFGASYEVRSGTNSRTPEAVVLIPTGSTLTATGVFVRDTF